MTEECWGEEEGDVLAMAKILSASGAGGGVAGSEGSHWPVLNAPR